MRLVSSIAVSLLLVITVFHIKQGHAVSAVSAAISSPAAAFSTRHADASLAPYLLAANSTSASNTTASVEDLPVCRPAYSTYSLPTDRFSYHQLRQGAVLIFVVFFLYILLAIHLLTNHFLDAALVRGATSLGFQDDVAGGSSTSLSVLFISFIGVFFVDPDYCIGTVVGASFFKSQVLLMACALMAPGLQLPSWPLVRDVVYFCFCVLFVGGMVIDQHIMYFDGIILLCLYIIYVLLMKYNERLRDWVKSEQSQARRSHRKLKGRQLTFFRIVEGWPFAVFITLIILLNLVVIVIEWFVRDRDWQIVLNGFFSVVFILEMLMKWYVYGIIGYWSRPADAFDGVLVLLILAEFIFAGRGFIGSVRALRIFRFLRALRTLRFCRLCVRGGAIKENTQQDGNRIQPSGDGSLSPRGGFMAVSPGGSLPASPRGHSPVHGFRTGSQAVPAGSDTPGFRLGEAPIAMSSFTAGSPPTVVHTVAAAEVQIVAQTPMVVSSPAVFVATPAAPPDGAAPPTSSIPPLPLTKLASAPSDAGSQTESKRTADTLVPGHYHPREKGLGSARPSEAIGLATTTRTAIATQRAPPSAANSMRTPRSGLRADLASVTGARAAGLSLTECPQDGFLSTLAFVLGYPVLVLYSITIPPCRSSAWRSWWPVALLTSSVWLAGLSYLLVWCSAEISRATGIPNSLMALLFVAAGVALPDTVAIVREARQEADERAILLAEGSNATASMKTRVSEHEVVANAIGRNLLDLLVASGLPWLIWSLVNPTKQLLVYSSAIPILMFLLFVLMAFVVISMVFFGWHLESRLGWLWAIFYAVFVIVATITDLDVVLPLGSSCITRK